MIQAENVAKMVHEEIMPFGESLIKDTEKDKETLSAEMTVRQVIISLTKTIDKVLKTTEVKDRLCI